MSLTKFRGHKRTTGEAGIVTTGVFRELRPLNKPFGFLVLKPSGMRFAKVLFRNYLVNWGRPILLEFGLGLDLSG